MAFKSVLMHVNDLNNLLLYKYLNVYPIQCFGVSFVLFVTYPPSLGGLMGCSPLVLLQTDEKTFRGTRSPKTDSS